MNNRVPQHSGMIKQLSGPSRRGSHFCFLSDILRPRPDSCRRFYLRGNNTARIDNIVEAIIQNRDKKRPASDVQRAAAPGSGGKKRARAQEQAGDHRIEAGAGQISGRVSGLPSLASEAKSPYSGPVSGPPTLTPQKSPAGHAPGHVAVPPIVPPGSPGESQSPTRRAANAGQTQAGRPSVDEPDSIQVARDLIGNPTPTRAAGSFRAAVSRPKARPSVKR
jgi:hypothetical protein